MAAANAFHQSCLLFAAIEIDLFTRLAELGRADAEAVAEACRISRRGARLLLDACVADGWLDKNDAGYANCGEANAFLVEGSPGDLRRAIGYNRDVYDAWGRLAHFVRRGTPVERPQTHLGEDRRRTRNFVMAMHGRAMAIGRSVVPLLDLDHAANLLDVGGGSGAYSILLAQRHPRLRCLTLDLPAVSAIAREYVEAAGLAGRIECAGADYHQAALPGGFDAAICFGVLHQESPDAISELLSRIAASLKPGGKVYLLDMMTDHTRCRPRFSAFFALNMALTTDHGWVFSDRDLQNWLSQAGFRDFTCQPLPPPMPHWLASARKA